MDNKHTMNIVLAVVICLVLVGILIFININNKVDMVSDNNIGDTNTSDISSDTSDRSNDAAASTENTAKAGDTVSMNYTGRLENGTVFDSNVDPKFNHVEPFVFTLGAGQVISGWDKGIVGMKVGEKKTLTIAPENAYGAGGIPGVIPPNATLVFDVELVEIINQ